MLNKITFLLFLLLSVVFTGYSQLDHTHYLPPLKQTLNEKGFKEQEIYFSTPETTPFSVNIYRGSNPTPISVITNLSNNNPKSYNPGNGDNNITLVTNANTGIVLSNSGLRFESNNGEIFYANYRGRSEQQAGSLTCKGQAALGTEFRWGGLPNKSIKYDQVSTSLGIMATQDNTEIIISDYDPNCEFRLQNDPDGITDNSISKILQKGESFVLEALPGESAANIDGWIGAKIVSNLPIALSNGSLNVGVVSGAKGRDVGIDQPIPVNLLGKKHVFIRGKGANNTEFPLIVAYQDNTEVYVGGTLYATLNDGDYVEVTGDNYSSTNPGANMYVSSSKSVYAYQCITGQDGTASDKTIGMNYVAPLNCLLPQELNQVSSIDRIAGLNSDESAITIIASSSIPDSDIQVNDLNGPVTLPAGSPVAGTSEWKTFYLTNLEGNVDVSATGPIAVGTFMRHGTFAGLAGYFSGFDTAPDLEIISTVGHCLSGIYLSTNSTVYESYQWYYENTLIPGETSNSLIPSQSGEYSVQISQGLCTILSDNFTVKSCPTNIDFDGVDDYLETPSLLNNLNEFSTMAWVKLDPSFSQNSFLFGEDNTSLSINSDRSLTAIIKTDLGSYNLSTTQQVPLGKWAHIAYTYDGNQTHIYINGSIAASLNTTGNQLIPSNTDFSLGKNPLGDIEHINANIQELRVYKKALTTTQLQEQVYQRILNNNGEIQAELTLHKIQGIVWDDLILYLKMLSVSGTGTTPDSSLSNQEGELHNILTQQATTAPLPYVANKIGKWSTGELVAGSPWEHGDVWDIPIKDWSIVQVSNLAILTSDNDRTLLGSIVDSGSKLWMANDNELKITKYLKLDGDIKLFNESQLIQTEGSNLDITSAGYLERDRPGMSNLYRYNYRSSPVSKINSTTNHLNYSVRDVLKGADGKTIDFVGGYDGSVTPTTINIAEYWIYKFDDLNNGYSQWVPINADGELKVGQGFTLKGSGAVTPTQNYTFKGKPNNGDITLDLKKDNIYLVGNPYPSAINANQFIHDNISTSVQNGSGNTTGTIYYWEHYGGDSHYLAQYQGGYATYNLIGHTATAHPMVSNQGTAILTPKQYIPVGQGFFVQSNGVNNGKIVFKNSQRIFEKESGGNSQFFRNSNTQTTTEETNDDIKRVHFYFWQNEGVFKDILLGVKDGLSLDVEYGYDGPANGNTSSDCNWNINDTDFVIQGIGSINNNLELSLKIQAENDGLYTFEMGDFSDFDESIEVFLKDEFLGTTTALLANTPIELDLTKGAYTNRFSVVFKKNIIEDNFDDIIHDSTDNVTVFYNDSNKSIDIKNSTEFSVSNFSVYNMLGQKVVNIVNELNNKNEVSVPVSLATGAYVVTFKYNNEQLISKKLIIR